MRALIVAPLPAVSRPPVSALRGAALGLAALLGLGWVGLRARPRPFPAYQAPSRPAERVPLPSGLPAPVERFFHATLGEQFPVISSAVLSGRGQMRLGGMSLHCRLRFVLAAGQGYRHYIEATWLGLPLLRVNERYLDHQAVLELPWGRVEREPRVDQSANLNLWGESFWLPSSLLLDPRLRWEPVDEQSARLVVPFGAGEDSLVARFDPRTGLLTRTDSLRYRAAGDREKKPFQSEVRGWSTFDGQRVPAAYALTWLDQGAPWLEFEVESAVYNVDVEQYIRSTGL
jgi:hypothetical protein